MYDLVFKTEDMKVEIEWFDNKPFIHCEVYNWSASVYKEHIHYWTEFISILKQNGIQNYYSLLPKDNKILKFNKMMGLKIYKELENHYLMIGE